MKRDAMRGPPAAEDVRRATKQANSLATLYNHDHFGSEHLLGGLLHDETSAAAGLLRDLGVDPRAIKGQLMARLVPGADMGSGSRITRTPCLVRAIEVAEATAAECRHPQMDTRHLLLGLAMSDGLAAELLRQAGVSVEALRSRLGGLPPMCQGTGAPPGCCAAGPVG
jgi:ATP-dependent Clp protease ATP-binding subunit ClpC